MTSYIHVTDTFSVEVPRDERESLRLRPWFQCCEFFAWLGVCGLGLWLLLTGEVSELILLFVSVGIVVFLLGAVEVVKRKSRNLHWQMALTLSNVMISFVSASVVLFFLVVLSWFL